MDYIRLSWLKRTTTGCILLFLLMSGCKTDYSPKPRDYFRIGFPEKQYQLYQSECGYKFEYPIYGKVIPNTTKTSEKCWVDIAFLDYKGTLYLSYKEMNGNLDLLTEDSRNLAYKHTYKAESIEEKTFANEEKKTYGILYDISGEAASGVQFYLTDSSKHFLRGALYFNVEINKDSLKPSIAFFREDVIHLMETLNWQ